MEVIKIIYPKTTKINWAREKDKIEIAFGNQSYSLTRGTSLLLYSKSTQNKKLIIDNAEELNLDMVHDSILIHINARRVFPSLVFSDYKSGSFLFILAFWIVVLTMGLSIQYIFSLFIDESPIESLFYGCLTLLIGSALIKYLFKKGDKWVYKIDFDFLTDY